MVYLPANIEDKCGKPQASRNDVILSNEEHIFFRSFFKKHLMAKWQSHSPKPRLDIVIAMRRHVCKTKISSRNRTIPQGGTLMKYTLMK